MEVPSVELRLLEMQPMNAEITRTHVSLRGRAKNITTVGTGPFHDPFHVLVPGVLTAGSQTSVQERRLAQYATLHEMSR